MMFGILAYKEEQWEAAATESSLAFNKVLDDHAWLELDEGYANWAAIPRSDMQMRVLVTEDFTKWFPVPLEGYKLAIVQYLGHCLTSLPPILVASYIGPEFVDACPRTHFCESRLRSLIRSDSCDDHYQALESLCKREPYLAAIGMPLAMAYFDQHGIPQDSEMFVGDDGNILTVRCPLSGDFFQRLVQARSEGIALRRSDLIKAVDNEG